MHGCWVRRTTEKQTVRFSVVSLHQKSQSLNTTKAEYIFVNSVAGVVMKREKSGI